MATQPEERKKAVCLVIDVGTGLTLSISFLLLHQKMTASLAAQPTIALGQESRHNKTGFLLKSH